MGYTLPFTRACLNFITLTFRALSRNQIVATPLEAIASLLCGVFVLRLVYCVCQVVCMFGVQ